MYKNQKGFTLIEMLMVVAILGIIVAIAVPQYMNYTRTSRCQQVVGPVHSTMVAVVGDFAENGTAADANQASAGNPESLTINGRTYTYPENVNISYRRGANNLYTVDGVRTDGVACPENGIYRLVEGETEGSWN